MLSSLIIVAFYQQPLAQAIALMVLDCLMLVFLIAKGPFREIYSELTQYFYELIVFAVHLMVLIMALMDQMGKTAFNLREKFGDYIITLNTVLFIGSMAFMCIEIYKKLIELYEAWLEYRKNRAALLKNSRSQLKSTETGGMSLSESQQTLTNNNRRRKISTSRNHILDTASELNLTLENEGSLVRERGRVDLNKSKNSSSENPRKARKREIKSYHASLRRRVPRELILPRDKNFAENKIHNAIFSGLNGQKEEKLSKWNPGTEKSKISTQAQEESNLRISEEDRFQTTTKKKSQELLSAETDLSPFQIPTLSFESNFRKNSGLDDLSQTVSRQGRRPRREITDLITYEPDPIDRPRRAVSQQNKIEERSESAAQRRNDRLKTRQEILRALNNKDQQETMAQYQGYVFQTVDKFVDKVMKEEE